MHRIDTSTAQKDKFGSGKNGFTGGNPQTGELPTALDADFFDSVQEEIAGVIEAAGLSLVKANNAQLLAAIKTLLSTGRLLNVQMFSASGIYIPTTGTKKIIVEVLGAGGAGGSSNAANTSSNGLGGGGGGGSYAKAMLNSVPSSQAVTVGTGGTATSSGTTGNKGGDSAFGSILAGGGQPGANNFGATYQGGNNQQRSASGGVASGGNLINAPGGYGIQAIWTTVGNCLSGGGGSSHLSGLTPPVGGGAAAGYAGSLGSGGSGANSNGTTGILLGGSGGNGIVIIWEYA